MKKILALVLSLVLVLSLCACGAKEEAPAAAPAEAAPAESVKIVVGASSTPHAEILEQVKAPLADAGYELEIVVYDDYVLPNTALFDGDLDANYFQHTPYLTSFNASNNMDLVSAALIHYEPFGLYGNGVSAVADIADGATIIIPADDSNETRALLLLEQEGLITLPEDASGEAAQYYANLIACRNGDENSEKITALVNALKTDAVKAYITDTYNGAVQAIF